MRTASAAELSAAALVHAVRNFQEAELEAPSPSSRPLSRTQPRLAAEAAALYKVELAEMKRILDSQGAKLPADRFDDTHAELLRFSTSAGLLQVPFPATQSTTASSAQVSVRSSTLGVRGQAVAGGKKSCQH